MARTKISEFSSTPANNTDIDSINIAEGCAPSNINDAIRELMAQLKDFQTGAVGDSFNGPIGTSTAAAGAFTTVSATGVITSTLATGTAPLTIASTTKVANLNVDLLDGADWASPAALGSTTPAAVSATTLSASSTVSGTGFSNYLASPPAIGGTTAAAGSFTTVNNSGGVRFNTSGTEYARMQLNSTSLELMAGSTTTAGITLNSSNVATLTNNPVLTAGTANGVTYLNGSKVLTSGSALTFDGTTVGIGPQGTSGQLVIADAITTVIATNQDRRYRAAFKLGSDYYGGDIFGGLGPSGSAIFGISTYDGSASPVISTLFKPAATEFYISGSEQMRLTSTGLGIGTSSPAYKLEVVAPAGDNIVSTFRSGDATAANNAGGGFRSISSATATSRIAQMWLDADGANLSGGDYFYIQKNGNSGNVDLVQYSNAAMTFTTNAIERMRLDSAGNLALGTTPSAWQSTTIRPIEINRIGNFVGGNGSAAAVYLGANARFESSSWRYANNGAAGLYTVEDNTHFWRIAGSGTAGDAISFTQAMTLTADGNLGVGTTSPTDSASFGRALDVAGGASAGAAIYVRAAASATNYLALGQDTSGNSYIINRANSSMLFYTNNTERARIDSSGNLLVGTTSTISGYTDAYLHVATVDGGKRGITVGNSSGSSGTGAITFVNSNGQVGYILTSGSTTTYATSSDYRLKNTIAPMTGALAKVAQLKPVTYKWNADGSDGEGFIAHELAEVVPQCVTGEKDAVDEEGNPQYQGIDTSFLVATLTAAIQELKAEFDAYKASHP